jgi:hypothetical protein
MGVGSGAALEVAVADGVRVAVAVGVVDGRAVPAGDGV